MRIQIKNPFDTYAETYDEKFNRNPLGLYQRRRIQQEISAYLSPRQKILDVGCGPGSDFEFYKSRNLSVDAIDISEKMVQLAQQKAEHLELNINLYRSSLEEFETGSRYDVIVLNFGVANALENILQAMQKLNYMLNRDGILVIVVMPPFHLFFVLEALLKLKVMSVLRRVFKHSAIVADNFKFSYYSKRYFTRYFTLEKKINLGAFLPTPDQYQRWTWAKGASKFLMSIDRRFAAIIPDWLGGDHVCYVLRKR